MSMPVQNQLGLYVKKSLRSCQRLRGETAKLSVKRMCHPAGLCPGPDFARVRIPQEGVNRRFLPVLTCIWKALGYNVSFPDRVL